MLRSRPRADTLSPCASRCQSVVFVQIHGDTSPPFGCNGYAVLPRLALCARRPEPPQYAADRGYRTAAVHVVQQHRQLVSAPEGILLSQFGHSLNQFHGTTRLSRVHGVIPSNSQGSPDDSRSSASSSSRMPVVRCRNSGTSAWRLRHERGSSQTACGRYVALCDIPARPARRLYSGSRSHTFIARPR